MGILVHSASQNIVQVLLRKPILNADRNIEFYYGNYKKVVSYINLNESNAFKSGLIIISKIAWHNILDIKYTIFLN